MWRQAKAAIFDLDGTLIDSMGVWERIDIEFLKRRGRDVPRDYMEAVKALDYARAAEYTIARFGLDESAQDVMDEWHAMAVQAYSRDIGLKDGALALLEDMRAHGLRIGLATASAQELYRPVLQNNGIYHYFHAFATTGEAGKGKGHPDVYWLCARRLEVLPQDCIVFEDILAGVKAARAAGMRVVGVYDRFSAHEGKMIRAHAHAYVQGLGQLV